MQKKTTFMILLNQFYYKIHIRLITFSHTNNNIHDANIQADTIYYGKECYTEKYTSKS